MSTPWDVVVIGGGPGGCAAATMLSRWGYKVLILEKEAFPRYHIGESLLPANWRIFDAMGVSDKIRAVDTFIPKAGGTFVWGLDREPWTVYFGEIDGQPAARQVKRDVFDKLLLDHAVTQGVTVRENCMVKEVLYEGDRAVGVAFVDADGQQDSAHARWVVDASGQAKLIGRRLGLVEYHPDFKNTAVWSYWEDGKRLEGYDSGNILYVTHEHGWFWYIPLDDATNMISVGTIIRPSGRQLIKEQGLDAFYQHMIAATDVLPEMLAGARQVAPVRAITDYSYCCSRLNGPGWFLVGDAACFVDPILSSGVQLASFHGLLAALTINTIARQPDLEVEARAYYERMYKHQYNTFVHLCQNMYDTQKKSKEDYFAGATSVVQPKAIAEVSGPLAQVGDRLAFISLISGTGAEETRELLANFFARRMQADTLQLNDQLSFSEEALSMLFDRIHSAELKRGRMQRIGEEEILQDDSLLRCAPEANIAEDFFLPAEPRQNTFARREVARNRFGDRFEATQELRTLMGSLNGGRPYKDVLEQFCTALEVDQATYREPFRKWIELLADYGLVEWQNL